MKKQLRINLYEYDIKVVTLKSCSKDHDNLSLEDAYYFCQHVGQIINQQTFLNFPCQALNPLNYPQKTHYRIPPIGLIINKSREKRINFF